MPTYVIQSQWTEQGIRTVKESANRLMRPWQRASCGSVRKATFEARR